MPSSDTSPTASSTTSSNSRPHKPSSAPVIAGTLAGCIVLIACILTFILIRKRRRRLLAEYAAHFRDPPNFPQVHPDKEGTLSKYTPQPSFRPPGTASSSGSSSAPPPPVRNAPQQHDHLHHNDVSHDRQTHTPRTRHGDQPPSPSSLHRPHHHQNTQPSPSFAVRPFPVPSSSTQLAIRLQSDLKERPHGPIDAVSDQGADEDDNNSNNNSNSIPGANTEPIFGSAGNSDVDGNMGTRRRGMMGVSVSGTNADVLPTIVVTREMEGGVEGEGRGALDGDGNSSALGTGDAGRRRSAQSAENGSGGNGVAGDFDYHDGGHDGRGREASGMSVTRSGLEYPYPGFVAGPNEDAVLPTLRNGSISRPPSSSSPPSSPNASLMPPSPTITTSLSSKRTSSRSNLEDATVLPTSISPVPRTQAHISEAADGIPSEEDAPPAYENLWPRPIEGERRRAELQQLQQARNYATVAPN